MSACRWPCAPWGRLPHRRNRHRTPIAGRRDVQRTPRCSRRGLIIVPGWVLCRAVIRCRRQNRSNSDGWGGGGREPGSRHGPAGVRTDHGTQARTPRALDSTPRRASERISMRHGRMSAKLGYVLSPTTTARSARLTVAGDTANAAVTFLFEASPAHASTIFDRNTDVNARKGSGQVHL
jgi:hypothetical protein